MSNLKAVILAAGMGLRLRPRTQKLPKGLLEVDGKTLLERSFLALKQAGMSEVVIAAGYLHEMIQTRFGDNFQGMPLRYILNAEYAVTGSMYSFSKTKEAVKNSAVLLLESDLLYDQQLIDIALRSPHRNVMLVSPLSGSGDEVYVCADKRNQLRALGKQLSDDQKRQACGEMVGISRFSANFLEHLFKTAEDDYARGERLYHYEECVMRATTEDLPVYTLPTAFPWIEIDREEDLKRAREVIYPRLTK
ncbi:phosphocholine cytidylyltransferase family protein [Candidatus Uhrbacteria bacterium]|nr:phosphocholine cytidylyltransferase family protein [Candidatus Uhrbacteria bacterium]